MVHTAESRKPPRRLLSPQEIALVLVTMIWGATFLVVHLAMRESGPLFFVALRFLSAGLILALLFRRHLARTTRRELAAGVAVGLAIFLGYALQSLGLQTVSSSESAFLTALYVPLVPVLQLVVLRRPPHPASWLGVLLAFAGLIMIAGPGAGAVGLGRGEVATLLGALAIAAEILLIGHFAPSVDLRRVTAIQLGTAGLVSLLLMPVAGEPLPALSAPLLAAALGLGAASALIQLVMNWAQRSVSPTRATLIYAGEPVWGGLVGRLAGDRLPPLSLAGAACILAAILVSELRPRWPRPRRPRET